MPPRLNPTPQERLERRRALARAAKARYRQRNPEAVRASQEKWKQNNPEAYRAGVRKWEQENREHWLATKRAWSAKHPKSHRRSKNKHNAKKYNREYLTRKLLQLLPDAWDRPTRYAVAAGLLLLIVDGETTLREAPKHVRRVHVELFGHDFKTISIDAPLGPHGMTIGDTLTYAPLQPGVSADGY